LSVVTLAEHAELGDGGHHIYVRLFDRCGDVYLTTLELYFPEDRIDKEEDNSPT